MHIRADCGQLGHAHEHVQHPIIPAGQKTGEVAPVLVCEVAERTGNRFLRDHFAKLAHDHEGNNAADRVTENHRRAGCLQYAGGAEKQAGADCPAQRDQLDVAILKPALQAVLLLCTIQNCAPVYGYQSPDQTYGPPRQNLKFYRGRYLLNTGANPRLVLRRT